MTINAFLSLVEIKTKTASVLAFLTGTLYTYYHFGSISLLQLVLFFASMIAFDMFTTGLNNFKDHQRALKKEGFNYEKHNAIVYYQLQDKTVKRSLVFLFIFASVCGISLVLTTDIFVLIIGMFAFAVGILYSAGPFPISRTPLGEVASGLAMGFGIPFLVYYIQMPKDNLFLFSLDQFDLTITFHWLPIVQLILITIPCICCIANIMLANNICDIEDDRANKRYTLPVVFGKTFSMTVFHMLYYVSFMSIPFAVMLGATHWASLFVLVTIFLVNKNLSKFRVVQTKQDTFGLSVQNFVVMCFSYAILIGLGRLFN